MTFVELTWWRNREYELFTVPPGRRWTPGKSTIPLPAVAPDQLGSNSDFIGIRSKSEHIDFYEPGKVDLALFRAFAEADTPAKMLAFCNKWGVPRTDMIAPCPDGKAGTASIQASAGELLSEAAKLRHAITLSEHGRSDLLIQIFNGGWATARLELQQDPEGNFVRALVPPTLLHFFWLQFGEHLAKGAETRICSCGEWFSIGPGYGRPDKKFCRPACKQAAHVKSHPRKPGS